MSDRFSRHSDALVAPARRFAALTPDDGNDLVETPKAIFVGTGGTLVVMPADGAAGNASVTFRNLPDASLLPIRARRVLATGTTASDLVVLF